MMSVTTRKPYTAWTLQNNVRLVQGGKEYFELLGNLIRAASDTIHLQVYIYEEDETGRSVAQELMTASRRGVKVYLVADGYASRGLSEDFIRRLRQAGIHFRFFRPIFSGENFYFGRRMHHKMLVVDALYSLVGGINISNKYNDVGVEPAWLDFALYAEGEISKELCILCYRNWKEITDVVNSTRCQPAKTIKIEKTTRQGSVRLRRNDWVRRRHQVSRSYLEMFRDAKDRILILSSYFLPGNVFRRAMVRAIRRGVKLEVIVAGISDVGLAKRAERFMYDWMLKNDIAIYEYQKSVLHGKVAVCDEDWITIGSYNVNNISAYASVELNLDVRDHEFASDIANMLRRIADEDCVRVTTENYKKTTQLSGRFLNWVSYLVFRIIFFLFTFYYKQH